VHLPGVTQARELVALRHGSQERDRPTAIGDLDRLTVLDLTQ